VLLRIRKIPKIITFSELVLFIRGLRKAKIFGGDPHPSLCLVSRVPAITILTRSSSVRCHVSQGVSLMVFLNQGWGGGGGGSFHRRKSKTF
jgi:hypothetical protein